MFTDEAGNPFGGLAAGRVWFVTRDVTPPALARQPDPPHRAIGVRCPRPHSGRRTAGGRSSVTGSFGTKSLSYMLGCVPRHGTKGDGGQVRRNSEALKIKPEVLKFAEKPPQQAQPVRNVPLEPGTRRKLER